MASTIPSDNPRCMDFPPLDGSLFLSEMVEFNAEHNPTHPFYTFHDERLDCLQHISHLEFYRACQRIAHLIRPGRQGPDNVVVAIIANCDTILSQALTVGIIHAGLIPFPISPRNSSAAVTSLMKKTGCHHLVATCHLLAPLLDCISAEFPDLQIQDSPTLAYAYPELGKETADTPFLPYPKGETRPSKDNIMLYLHSSGSTGLPKPIPITYLTAVHWCTMPLVRDFVDLPRHITICGAPLPPFHLSGILLQLLYPVAALQTVALFPPMSYNDPIKAPVIPNPQNTIEVIRLTDSRWMLVVPVFLEEWVASTEAIDVLRSLEYLIVGGGPLAKKTGDVLVAAGVKLSSIYGGTEFGPLTRAIPDPTEQPLWEWIRFGRDQRIRWVQQGDDTYECQLLTTPMHQLSVENLPDIKGYATSDVFVKHPTIEGLFKIVGRLDDVLTHSSGEKTVPAPMETVIIACPMLSGVCMFGRGRKQTGLLVEPRPEYAIDVMDDKQLAEFRNKIWPYVEEANKEGAAFSRIFKEMIWVTSRDKPVQRAGKGTVIKKVTMKLYESEINALYESVESSSQAGIDVPLPSTWSQLEVENWLAAHAKAVNAGNPVEVDVDIFQQGFDSLSSTFLRNRIMNSLSVSPREEVHAAASQIVQNIIFSNPTLQLLANSLRQLMAKDIPIPPSSDPKTEIESMISKYSLGVQNSVTEHGVINGSHVVLLTGSTGGLGSYLLASLLSREDLAIVYAFNRPSKTSTIQQRQRAAFENRGFDTNLLSSKKLIFVEGDAAQPQLSLDDKTYRELQHSVTVIIHNAWRVDFNLALLSFEPNVKGTRHLIDFARGSSKANKPRFLFTSSISSGQGWEKSRGAFPEETQLDAGVGVGLGYGASKYVSERILAVSGLSTTSFRVGQVTGGAPLGAWSTTEWIPLIVKSSVTLGALPDALGVVSWLPPHAVSDVMLDVAFSNEEPPPSVNVVHPRPIAWKSIMQPIGEALYRKGLTPSPLPLIPFAKWVERLERYSASDKSDEHIRRVPAIKIVEFMRALAKGDATMRCKSLWDGSDKFEAAGLTRCATSVAQQVSKTMRDLVSLSAVDAELWVSYWESVGMFVVENDYGE